MLDTRNSALANRQQSSGPPERPQPSGSSALSPIYLGSGLGVPQLSLQNMITASMVLKSSLDIEVDKGPGGWPQDIFTHTAAPSRQDTLLGEPSSGQLEEAIPGMPSPEERAIAALQREILLLRNELNLELWFGRENVKHIGRLHASRILSKNAEAERQALVCGFSPIQATDIPTNYSIFSSVSTTRFASIGRKSLSSSASSVNTKSKRPLPSTGPMTTRASCTKSCKPSGKRRRNGTLKQLSSAPKKRTRRYCLSFAG
jgi:hypothetical protein